MVVGACQVMVSFCAFAAAIMPTIDAQIMIFFIVGLCCFLGLLNSVLIAVRPNLRSEALKTADLGRLLLSRSFQGCLFCVFLSDISSFPSPSLSILFNEEN